IKPVLSDQQKINRVDFIISYTHKRRRSEVLVDYLYDWVHVDNKWFCILQEGQGVYLHPTENPPNLHGYSISEDVVVTNTEELVKTIIETIDVYPRETLDRIWQSLLAVYSKVLGS
ncbi:unnamed protein product, partial [Choristocarpus tenellus]